VLLQAIRDCSATATVLEPEDKNSRTSRRLAERTSAYLPNCRQNVLDMDDALDCSDFETVVILGHNLRGSGAALERAIDSADTPATRQCVKHLSTYLDRLASRPD